MDPKTKRFFANTHTQVPHEKANSFDDYIARAREQIATTRNDLNDQNRDKIIDANSPRQHRPDQKAKKGILLIHGLLDSPMILASAFDHFAAQGFLVRSLLLPGHGTEPSDLLNIHLEQWLDATRFALDSFHEQVDDLFVFGFFYRRKLSHT